MKWWVYVVSVVLLAAVLWLTLGCSHVASDLARRQREIQNCIVSGGTPELGPDDSIICR